MFKYRTAEKNDLESTYKKSSKYVANSLTHYKNLLFFFPFFVALAVALKNHLSFKEIEIF